MIMNTQAKITKTLSFSSKNKDFDNISICSNGSARSGTSIYSSASSYNR
jgi:hypothetical protein